MPLIRRMLMGPKVFLALPDACGLRPCDWTHLKNGLVPYFSGGGTENRYLSSLQPNTLAVRLTFNTLLPMLYLYFRSIYLFHVIPSSCLSSGPFTGPQQLSFFNYCEKILRNRWMIDFVIGLKFFYFFSFPR